MRPIAVVYNHIHETLKWIQFLVPVKSSNLCDREVMLENGKRLILINNFEQARGMEFSDYLIAPNYYDLLMEVKSRIK